MKQVVQRCFFTFSAYICCILASSSVQAQISVDGTIPTNVNTIDTGFEITGGTQAGSNLFHSFKEFSVPTGSEAFFRNTGNFNNIVNIINRVTGGSISNIDGLIKENYGANLILINPSGINFGPNARLNIGGSFLASTANSLKFADGTEFSAINAQASPTLTISVPVGLQFGQNPAAIRVQGTGHDFAVNDVIFSPIARSNSTTGLRVQPGQTLALVGGDINLEGGTLTAEAGRVELGSVAGGLVSLTPTSGGWTFGYEGVPAFKDINLSQKALLDASGVSGGSIKVQGRNLSVSEGSLILIQNQGPQPAGAITINTSESVKVSGSNADGTVRTTVNNQTVGTGKGGDINISTKHLSVEEGATIVATVFGPAAGGDVNVNASESVQLLGSSPIKPRSVSAISTATLNSGNAGNTTVSTKRLTATGGGIVASSTLGTGNGGNLTVTATDSIDIIGVEPRVFIASGLTVATLSAGNSGNLTVNTSRLSISGGGSVDASSLASGDGGSVTINASEFVEVKGGVPGIIKPSLIGSAANLVNETTQRALNLPPVPSGAAGELTINTSQLRVKDGATVSVKNDGTGDAGNLRVRADSILMDQGGSITAATKTGEGGNIFLQANSLIMRHRSQISAEAGGAGNGGNINITGFSPSDFVVLLEGSKISANAFEGRGGNIQIDTQGLFVCPECQITASSQLGLDGAVEILTPDAETNQEVIDLPQEIAKPEEVVAQVCSANREQDGNEFTITGRGGLPPRPSDPLSSEALISFEPLPTQAENNSSRSNAIAKGKTQTREIPLPARGWYVNPKGAVILTAKAPTVNPYDSGLTSSSCHAN